MFTLAPEPIQKLYGKSDIMSFGKYKGDTIKWIMENDPLYLEYIAGTSQFMTLDEEVKEELFTLCLMEADSEYEDDIQWDWGVVQ